MKIKVLFHTSMTVVRVGRLRVRLAYVYASYMYDSHSAMNHISTLIVRIGFLRTRQSYAYETETHIFISHFDAHVNHTHRICIRTSIIRKRFT